MAKHADWWRKSGYFDSLAGTFSFLIEQKTAFWWLSSKTANMVNCLKNKQPPNIFRNLSKNWFTRKICTNFRSLFDGYIGMNFSTDELIPFSDARSGLSRVIEDVMSGRELVVTKHGKMTVALVAASQFYQYREMERELNEFLAALEHDKSSSDTKLALTALKKRVAAKRKNFVSFMSMVPSARPLKGDEMQKIEDQKGTTWRPTASQIRSSSAKPTE